MLTKADKWRAFYLGLVYLALAEWLSRWTASFPFCLVPDGGHADGEGAGRSCAYFHEGAQRFLVFAWGRAGPFIADNHDAIAAVATACIAVFVLGLWRSTSRLLRVSQRQLDSVQAAAAAQSTLMGKSVAAATEAAAASRRHAATAQRAMQELERPFVFVFGVKYLKIDAERSGELEPFVEYTVANFGKTPAIIENIGAGFEAAGDEPQAPFQVDEVNPLVVAPILAPLEKRGPIKHYYPSDGGVPDFKFIGSGPFSSFAVLETKPREDLLFRVVIEYRGPFADEHKTSACWVYDKGTDTFIQRGGKEDNYLE